jgi:hypothetical protein
MEIDTENIQSLINKAKPYVAFKPEIKPLIDAAEEGIALIDGGLEDQARDRFKIVLAGLESLGVDGDEVSKLRAFVEAETKETNKEVEMKESKMEVTVVSLTKAQQIELALAFQSGDLRRKLALEDAFGEDTVSEAIEMAKKYDVQPRDRLASFNRAVQNTTVILNTTAKMLALYGFLRATRR